MNKTYLFAIAAALLVAPLAYAHSPAGPKLFCENSADVSTHDYLPPADGALIFVATNGDGAEDSATTCGGAAFGDAHGEYAHGGAWLSVDSGDLATYGSFACYGEQGHHPFYGPFTVVDDVLGAAQFEVAADNTHFPDPVTGIDCGDFQADVGATCTGTCTVTFPPGRDGTYTVFVTGTSGHVFA